MLSAQSDNVRTVDGIAREQKIANRSNALVPPLKDNEICRRSCGIVGIEHEDRRSTIHQSGNAVPVACLRVAAKVSAHLPAALEPKPVDEVEAGILGPPVADGGGNAGI